MAGDGRMPHRYPPSAPDEVLAWRCGECDHITQEFGPADTTECPIDWRADLHGHRHDSRCRCSAYACTLRAKALHVHSAATPTRGATRS